MEVSGWLLQIVTLQRSIQSIRLPMESRGQAEEQPYRRLEWLPPGMEVSGSPLGLEVQTQLPLLRMESHGRAEQSRFQVPGMELRGMDASGSQLEVDQPFSRLPMESRGRHKRPQSSLGTTLHGMEVSGSR